MDDAEVKAMRQALRQVNEHLAQAHQELGAEREALGLADVVFHSNSNLPALNYVTPRKNTAWVSGKEIEQGLERLRALHRVPRVMYIEGLFPPLFAKTLRALGLEVSQETPVMLYRPAEGLPQLEAKPEDIYILTVENQHGAKMWRDVRSEDYYIASMGVEPLFVGQEMDAAAPVHQIDIIAYRYGDPVGGVRVTLYEGSAHIAALAVKNTFHTPALIHLLQVGAIEAAVEHDCALIFAPGETEEDRRLCRELGFVDSGSIVCYSEKLTEPREDTHDDTLAQPVLVLR